jgi:hypothetical protein
MIGCLTARADRCPWRPMPTQTLVPTRQSTPHRHDQNGLTEMVIFALIYTPSSYCTRHQDRHDFNGLESSFGIAFLVSCCLSMMERPASHRQGEPLFLLTAQPLTALSISQFAITIQSGTFFSSSSFLTFYSFVSAFSLKCRLGMRNHSQELCRQPPSHVVPTNIHINSKYSNTIHTHSQPYG